ncbi:unnamed protein product [Staurois parvus]|uniref:Uncharacterized protein n=1 Tax=Staurois parvus TaxID=386267 RepID=A0ABN9CNR5_9NEOB|nr:unnamed protein product [Staurois parvus]
MKDELGFSLNPSLPEPENKLRDQACNHSVCFIRGGGPGAD